MMTILGLGTQIHDCSRVRKLIERHGERFLYQVFTEAEIEACNARTHSTEHFAGVWAIKEAVLRSLGTRWKRSISWHDVEISAASTADAKVKLAGHAKQLAETRGVKDVKVSFAYTRMYATATAIAIG